MKVGDLVVLASPYCEGNIYKIVKSFKDKHSSIGLDCFGDGIMVIDKNDEIELIATKEKFESIGYKVG